MVGTHMALNIVQSDLITASEHFIKLKNYFLLHGGYLLHKIYCNQDILCNSLKTPN